MSSPPSPNTPTTPDARVEQVVTSMARNLAGRMDRYFSCLMVAQWLAALGVALWVTPRTWVGAVSSPNPYIAIALVFGGIVSLVPAALAWLAPGERWTRHLIAAGQMLMSTLLIHLSGGRIETHFHIFGSLAFLACYLDWTVLLTASAVILLDHTVGNFLWPHAVFGPSNVESWRWLEHVGWVVFCDAFLIATCISRMRSLRTVAGKTVEQDGLLTRAYTDALTGLPNRLRFQKQVESAVATAKANGSRFSLMYIDLDRFKEVNDTFGHALGDKVLLEVAARLTVGQNEDTMFARIGGDEFVAVCTGQGAHGAIDDRARDILTSLLSPIHIDGHDIVIGASIGVSQYPEDGSDQDQLLSHADTAMYNVKRKRRRGYTFYDDAMNATTEQRAQGQARLRSAIEHQEFSVHYQPLINSTGELSGFEALLRWHPAGEAPVPPSTFIPLAEDAGLISALGQLVLEKVCFQIAAWRRFGLPFGHVALNLSPKQLEEPGFLASLDDTMQRFGIDPRWLALEITESAYAADDQVMAALLDSFRERRIAVSLDDFGTGYSSLGRLQGLAFTTLKIDQIFIGRVDGSNTGYHVVQAIINLAHVLGMKVVAEGVETAGQLEALKRLGCDQMQGYYFSRPMPADAVPEFIEKMLSERFSTAHAPTPAELPWRQPHALLAAGAEAAPTDARYRARAIL